MNRLQTVWLLLVMPTILDARSCTALSGIALAIIASKRKYSRNLIEDQYRYNKKHITETHGPSLQHNKINLSFELL